MTRRFWRARWLWIVFVAGGLALFFLLRGGDLATFWPGDYRVGADRSTAEAAQPNLESENISETIRHRSRQVRQRDAAAETNPPTSRSAADERLQPGNPGPAPVSLEYERMAGNSPSTDFEQDPGNDEDGLAIGGTVLDRDGVPLPGIRVEGRALSAYLPDPGNASTNALGMFSFPSLEAGEYALMVPESNAYHAATVQVRAGSASVEIYLQPKGEVAVHGLVHDESGEPLHQVVVRLLGAGETRSLADGSYRVSGPWPKAGQAPVVEFRHPDYLLERRALASQSASAGSEVRLDVRLKPRESSAVLAGRLTGPRGETVANARVWVSSSSPPVYRQDVTDAAGQFVIERLEPGGHFLLGVSPPEGYANWVSEPMAIVAGNNRRDIELDRDDRGALFGAVTDPQGRPLRNFALWARSVTPAGQTAMPIVTDAGGQFWLPDVAAGTLQLETRSLPRLEARGIRIDPNRDNQVVVPMDWGEEWLFGKVVDEQGGPVAGATISLQWGEQYPDLYSTSVRQVRSDHDGQFVFSNLGAEHYALVARADGHATKRVQHVPVGQGSGEVQVVLESATGSSAVGGGQ